MLEQVDLEALIAKIFEQPDTAKSTADHDNIPILGFLPDRAHVSPTPLTVLARYSAQLQLENDTVLSRNCGTAGRFRWRVDDIRCHAGRCWGGIGNAYPVVRTVELD
jgi:hypothetical protein